MQHLVRHEGAAHFLRDVRSFLERREAVNSLLLGLADRLVGEPLAFGDAPPYFAAVHDETGPVLAALMTPPHYLILSTEGKEGAAGLELLARDLMSSGLPMPGAHGPLERIGSFAAMWSILAGVASRAGAILRLYELREVIPPRPCPGRLRQAGAGDADLIVAWTDAFHREATPNSPPPPVETTRRRVAEGHVYIWDDAGSATMAFKTRPTQHGITIGGVYTPPDLRRRGYATSCVAALSQQLLDGGYEYCILYTNLSNPTSNDIYQQIGYRPVCDFQEVHFSSGTPHEPT